MIKQSKFSFLDNSGKQPLVVSYGLGVDSTAALVGLYREGVRPDAILFADVGTEKQETYDYLPVINGWLREVNFPEVTVVRNLPTRENKNFPPYDTLIGNCLSNGTLPSLAFGFKSCSLKWKVEPQNRWTKQWQMAIDWWEGGGKVKKIIGYDNSPNDKKRFAHAVGLEDPSYEYWYPLIEWGWDRDRCKAEITKEGLPVPPKSACIICPATQPDEIRAFKKNYLRTIVIVEARAKPRLNAIEGLWRNGVKGTRGGQKRPGSITQFIREEGLLPSDEIDMLIEKAPLELIQNHQAFLNGLEVLDWHDFLEQYTVEDAAEECVPKMRNKMNVLSYSPGNCGASQACIGCINV